MALPIRPPYTNPIPNDPFYYPQTNYIRAENGPFIIGSGFSINNITGTINSTGVESGVASAIAGPGISVSSATGNVTFSNTGVRQLAAAGGLSVNAATGNVTVTLDATGVTPGSYTHASITVDAEGRISSAVNGSAATPTVAGVILGCTIANNSALGCNALLSRTGGTGNVAIGDSALCSLVASNFNIAIGDCALQNYTANSNIAIGRRSLCSTTTGNNNVALGNDALQSNVTGSSNVAIGIDAMRLGDGSSSIAIGNGALINNSGFGNVALGGGAGNNVTTGCCNTFLGSSSGSGIVAGCCNVFLGSSSGTGADVSCCLSINVDSTLTWLTGNSTGAIKPAQGIIDCANVCGTAGQVLTSTGTALEWRTLPGYPVIRSSSQTNTYAGAFVPIVICYSTVIDDTTTWYNGATGVFQPDIAGYYQITAMARTCTLNTGDGESVISIICNGTNYTNQGAYGQINGNVSSLVYMNGTTDALCVTIAAAASGVGCTVTQPSTSRFTAILTALA